MQLLQIHEPGETPLPHEHDGAAVGIDLGTTYSVVAVSAGGKAEVLRDSCGGALVPSVVHYNDKGEPEVGKRARVRFQEGDVNAVASIKRLMGRGAKDIPSLNLHYVTTEDADGVIRLKAGNRALTAVEVSADILKQMKTQAEEALGYDVKQAVITVPAYFDDAARHATKDAARLAGLDVLRLINEPTAAALAYGLDSGEEGIYIIYDLGGGTFDVSILRLEKGVFQVLATAGHVALGGDDFDHAIADFWKRDDLAKGTLLSHARHAKEDLSEKESSTTDAGSLTREQLSKLVQPFIDESLAICGRALEDAKLTAKDVKGVVLVGGSTRMLRVREEVERFFGQKPFTGINPDEVVAIGAAIQAEALTRGSDTLLLDVVPLSLGLETMGGIVEKIIHRNTPIPVAVEQEFTTYQDNQNGMIIHVLQGEREMTEQNRSLARFELSGIPALPAGIARVKVRFSVDADGLLTVSAEEATTGVQQQVAVKPSYGLSGEAMEKMLMDSMQFAKEDIMERLLREAGMEAGRGIEEVRSALASDGDLLADEEKTAIQQNITLLEQDIASRDRDRIDAGKERLMKLAQPFAERRMDRAIASALKGAHVDKIANG